MDWKQILEILSPVAVIFAAGRLAQQIKTMREDMSELRPILKQWEAVLIRIATMENVVSKLASDHRQLRNKLGETREEMASFHDKED
jgi:predicted  nucleic acid-binding Zn-ribbon protein